VGIPRNSGCRSAVAVGEKHGPVSAPSREIIIGYGCHPPSRNSIPFILRFVQQTERMQATASPLPVTRSSENQR
jgi:hypothetical protein